MKSIGEIRQEQAAAARESGPKQSPPSASTSDGILGTPPQHRQPAVPPPVFVTQAGHSATEHFGTEVQLKKPWMPKMDFPKFDGTGARIWIDQCEAFFQLYNIRDSFRVASASLNLVDNAAHWFQSYKQMGIWPNWQQFCEAVTEEFDINVHESSYRS